MPFPFTKPENRESGETASLMLLHFRKNSLLSYLYSFAISIKNLFCFPGRHRAAPLIFSPAGVLSKLVAGWFPQPGHITPGFGEKGIVFEMDSPVSQR